MDFGLRPPNLTSEGFSMKESKVAASGEERKATYEHNTSRFYNHIRDSLDSDRLTQNHTEEHPPPPLEETSQRKNVVVIKKKNKMKYDP